MTSAQSKATWHKRALLDASSPLATPASTSQTPMLDRYSQPHLQFIIRRSGESRLLPQLVDVKEKAAFPGRAAAPWLKVARAGGGGQG